MNRRKLARTRKIYNKKNQPEAEKKFKRALIYLGIRFEEQKVVYFKKSGKFFLLDFYLPDYKIGVELDGIQHEQNVGYDQWRDSLIEQKLRCSVLRIPNEEIYRGAIECLKRLIRDKNIYRKKREKKLIQKMCVIPESSKEKIEKMKNFSIRSYYD